ncbi:hypothetical protein ACSDQ9_06940 [Aestuariimicrobium soli]|uniref:hypothetical protein n=1 Tax=Aestuariimicrobium soli TaxID=2035834 RepID=UPI003EBA5C50
MNENLTDDDLLLLARIATAEAAHDPLPHGLLERLHFALSMQAMEAELATITDEHLALARGGPVRADTITFTSSTISLTVLIAEDDGPSGGSVRIDGWVTGGGVRVELVTESGSTSRTSDATGRLVWDEVPHGPVHFLVHPVRAAARPVVTPPIEV